MTIFGYPCINMTLTEGRSKKDIVTTNRGMIYKTFLERGIKYASELAFKNVKDLEKIIHWNERNKIRFFRISSDLFPWASHYAVEDMPEIENISKTLKRIGNFTKEHNHRLTFHPGPFNKLTSDDERIIRNTISDLKIHGIIFDLIGASQTPYNKINIHVGAHYNNKEKALYNFCKNFNKLPDNVKNRLTVENDDKESLYSVNELYHGIYKNINIPIVFDYHHHKFCTGNLSEYDALLLAISTWKNIKPVTHYSESKCEEQNVKCKPQAHSDYIKGPINVYDQDIDIMIEAKQKEKALVSYKIKHEIFNIKY